MLCATIALLEDIISIKLYGHPSILTVNREEDNSYDSCAVAVCWDDCIVGHLPRDISEVSWFFLLHGGNISCEITGHRKFGVGLEVPCSYKYTGPPKLIKKLKKRLQKSLPKDT